MMCVVSDIDKFVILILIFFAHCELIFLSQPRKGDCMHSMEEKTSLPVMPPEDVREVILVLELR